MQKFALAATAALLFASTAAQAGDWSGFYVQGHADAGWLRSEWSGTDSATGFTTANWNPDNRDTGWGAGVGLGYNLQFGQLVVGAIGDWTWMDANDTKAFAGAAGPDAVRTRIHGLGTLRGVVGLDLDHVMPYGTVGWSWSNVSRDFVAPASGLKINSDADDGWTAGGGLKFALAPATALTLEALYVDFGSASKSAANATAAASIRVKTNMTLARVGIEFRF